MRIVMEDLRGCIGRDATTPDFRYYVIKTPINETGICHQFETKAEAEAFIAEKEKPAQSGLTQLITYIIAHRPGAAQRPI